MRHQEQVSVQFNNLMAQPHTVTKNARACESCHIGKKVMGYGINGGKYFADQTKTTITDLMTADQKLLPKKVDEQIPAIPNLKYDYFVMIDNKMHRSILNKLLNIGA